MSNLQDFYKQVGGDADEIVARLGGSQAFLEKFLIKFLSDGSFDELTEALNEGDVQTSFRCAHTLKGVAVNLGLQTLFQKASNVTEFLRAGNLTDAKVAFPELQAEYNRTCDLIKADINQ